MAQLFFEVENQTIIRTDNFKPAAKSKNYLYAHFDFLTEDWENKIVTAIFRHDDIVKEVILDNENSCLVPWEVLENTGDVFVSCYSGDLITVNKSRVQVYESGYDSDIESESEEPTPSIYIQLINKLEEIESNHNNIDGGLFTDWK